MVPWTFLRAFRTYGSASEFGRRFQALPLIVQGGISFNVCMPTYRLSDRCFRPHDDCAGWGPSAVVLAFHIPSDGVLLFCRTVLPPPIPPISSSAPLATYIITTPTQTVKLPIILGPYIHGAGPRLWPAERLVDVSRHQERPAAT